MKTQSFIKDSFIFCDLKSVHFEFLKTVPKFATVDLYLLLRSKIICSQPEVLWLYLVELT